MSTQILWFRRDLRVHDHPALTAAAAEAETSGGDLLCVFVLDPHLLSHDRMSPARLGYLRHALGDLSASLADRGNELRVLHGDPIEVLTDLARSVGATEVHVSGDHSPFAVARDDRAEAALSEDGRELVRHPGVTIAEPGTVLTGSGTTYKVFTPFFRTWREQDHGKALDAPASLPSAPEGGPAGIAVSSVDALAVQGPQQPWTQGTDAPSDGGETAARVRMQAWLAGGVDAYDETRNTLAAPGTSRLSPDLHFGCLSPRELLQRLEMSTEGHDVYASELAWRDFYLHVYAEWPHAASSAFRERYADLPWHDDADGLQAWKDGMTGFPIVDAGMRQLRQTGWMHNRARMIVASFLCKDLLIDWRSGEAHFMATLVDGDAASNNGGWQWAAGTGTDAQPFIRIFNPITQGQRFDPDGDYVRAFVPELAEVPAAKIHAPWTLSAAEQTQYGVVIGTDYPAPIVDHAAARERALAWWDAHA